MSIDDDIGALQNNRNGQAHYWSIQISSTCKLTTLWTLRTKL